MVWNVGTAYFGCGTFDANGERKFDPDMFKVNAQYVKMIEIKLSQGAKPGTSSFLFQI